MDFLFEFVLYGKNKGPLTASILLYGPSNNYFIILLPASLSGATFKKEKLFLLQFDNFSILTMKVASIK